MESIAPSRRSESSQELAALQENAGAPDRKSSKPPQNYALSQNSSPAPLALQPAPAAPPALVAQTELARTNNLVPAPAPAPAPTAPPADSAQNNIAGFPASADRAGAVQGGFSKGAARAARERNALEPVNLQSASAAGDLDQATLLLDQGASVDTRDALGRTPLLLAVAQNRLAVVRLLLARGADPNAADNAGLTPLQQAKNKDLRDVAALLEQAGAR
jgi:ankyrin repeat protein